MAYISFNEYLGSIFSFTFYKNDLFKSHQAQTEKSNSKWREIMAVLGALIKLTQQFWSVGPPSCLSLSQPRDDQIGTVGSGSCLQIMLVDFT